MRLIDADELRRDISRQLAFVFSFGDAELNEYGEALRKGLFQLIDNAPTIYPDTYPVTRKALEAGKRGEEVRFYIGGRKFAVRELAQ